MLVFWVRSLAVFERKKKKGCWHFLLLSQWKWNHMFPHVDIIMAPPTLALEAFTVCSSESLLGGSLLSLLLYRWFCSGILNLRIVGQLEKPAIELKPNSKCYCGVGRKGLWNPGDLLQGKKPPHPTAQGVSPVGRRSKEPLWPQGGSGWYGIKDTQWAAA